MCTSGEQPRQEMDLSSESPSCLGRCGLRREEGRRQGSWLERAGLCPVFTTVMSYGKRPLQLLQLRLSPLGQVGIWVWVAPSRSHGVVPAVPIGYVCHSRIIGTPGRLMHVAVEMNLKLHSVEYVVFDEADRSVHDVAVAEISP